MVTAPVWRMVRLAVAFFLVAASGLARGDERASTLLTEDAKLHGDGGGGGPGAPNDRFGQSVTVDGDTAVVGATGDHYVINGGGVARVLVRSDGVWVEQQRLEPADSQQAHGFGSAVAVAGDTALVGAVHDNQQAQTAGAVYVFVRDGSTWTQEQKLVVDDAEPNDQLGLAVALEGDVALLGSRFDDDAGSNSGSAYLFVRSGGVWSQRQKLTASDATAGDQLGSSVALSGTTALIGAAGSGSVYVFVEDGGVWAEQQKLTPDGTSGGGFGTAVALAGDTALVGAPSAQGTVAGSGSAYLFVRSGGTFSQQQELAASDGATGDHFGESVWLGEGLAVIGSSYDDDAGSGSGSAYIFALGEGVWSEQAKLVAADAAAGAAFGTGVSLSGSTVLIGAPSDDEGGEWSGAAYAFVSSGGQWTQQQKLMGNATAAGDLLGLFLAMSGDTLLVGAPMDARDGAVDGTVYVLERSGGRWTIAQKLTATGAPQHSFFGQWIALSGDLAAVGAMNDNEGGACAGAAYIFARVGDDWVLQQKLVASDAQPDQCFGRAVAVSSDTVLVTTGCNDQQPGSVYVYGLAEGAWVEQQQLTAPEPSPGDYFGFACAVEGDTALIGASGDDEAAPDAGAVYVLERSGGVWLQVQKLIASDATEGTSLGWPALEGNTALIGAGGEDGAGAVYVFEREGGVWVERQKVTAEDPEPGAGFGTVSLDGDLALVTAFQASCASERSGAAYVLERSDGVWSQRHKLCASDGSSAEWFGFGSMTAGSTVVVGAPADDDDGWRSGSLYLFNVPLFVDGFESGDTAAWSTAEP